jgi:hypothetical protein
VELTTLVDGSFHFYAVQRSSSAGEVRFAALASIIALFYKFALVKHAQDVLC